MSTRIKHSALIYPCPAAPGFESYIFKFSTLEQSSAITTGCTKFLSPAGGPQLPGTSGVADASTCGPAGTTLCKACGMQKTGVFWADNLANPFPIGDSSLSAEGARLLFVSLVGNKTLETVTGVQGTWKNNAPGITNNPWSASSTEAAPATLSSPIGVVNDGFRRILLWVNEGYNPMDATPGAGTCPASGGAKIPCYPGYGAVANTITVDISAWSVPVTATLVHNVVAAGSMGEVAGISVGAATQAATPTRPATGNAANVGTSTGCTGANACQSSTTPSGIAVPNSITAVTVANGNYATVTLTAPAFSVNQLVAPAVAQTETLLPAAGDTQIRAGANAGLTYGTATSMAVSTSATAVHDTTSVALVQFTIPGTVSAANTLTAVLELTITALPTADMPMLVVGIAPGQAGAWSESTLTWTLANFLTNGSLPATAITSPAGNFVPVGPVTGAAVAGHITVVAATAKVGDVQRVDVSEYLRTCSGSAAFAIVRRIRYGPFFGNSGGSIAGDTLSGGASVSFATKEAASGAPQLRLMTGPAAFPAIAMNPGAAPSAAGAAASGGSSSSSPAPGPPVANPGAIFAALNISYATRCQPACAGAYYTIVRPT